MHICCKNIQYIMIEGIHYTTQTRIVYTQPKMSQEYSITQDYVQLIKRLQEESYSINADKTRKNVQTIHSNTISGRTKTHGSRIGEIKFLEDSIFLLISYNIDNLEKPSKLLEILTGKDPKNHYKEQQFI